MTVHEQQNPPAINKRRTWTNYIPRPGSRDGRPGSSSGSSGGYKMKETAVPVLAPPQEGKELDVTAVVCVPGRGESSGSISQRAGTPSSEAGSPPPSRPASRPTTPKRSFSSLLLTSSSPMDQLDHEHDQPTTTPKMNSSSSSFGKGYLSSMIGGLSLSLSRTSTRDSVNGGAVLSALEEEEREREELQREQGRGRALFKSGKRTKSASQAPPDSDVLNASRNQSRARSTSPFFFRRKHRDSSPTPQPLPLAHSETDLSDAGSIHPRNAFTDDQDSGDEAVGETDYSDDDLDDGGDFLDPVTERNTEHNAIITPVPAQDGPNALDEAEPDPLGEGVNVVVPPEPYFESTLNSGASTTRNRRNPRRRKSVKHHDPLPHHTSRPVFQRDRATITVTQGDPVGKLGSRKKRKYVVASDLSEESRYAVEWGIGTVLRDGDEMLVVTVVENENKIDPEIPNQADRTLKLRSQQERQGLAYILVRQATSLLQRTRLNVTVACQAWHAKNARHMLLGPQMLIVGSRGLGQLNGILLGSTSHYLIQKCSVPVMVARRRLKRPPKRSAHLSTHRQHVKLSEAGIDRVAAKVDQDVKVMRDEIQKEDSRRDGGPGSRDDKIRRGLVGEELLEQDEEEEGEVSAEGEGEGDVSADSLDVGRVKETKGETKVAG
ncbi:hypothetical protein AN958_07677 [Leucoagaricus sp. SymC.cos]|nr:hypothetical protein AN958_07677 [Leucoagaricus sp. SymC.cos]